MSASASGASGFGFLDESAEFGELGFVDGVHAVGVLFFGVRREDDDAGVGLFEAGVDARDDVAGGSDFVLVEPGVDAVGEERFGEGDHGGLSAEEWLRRRAC